MDSVGVPSGSILLERAQARPRTYDWGVYIHDLSMSKLKKTGTITPPIILKIRYYIAIAGKPYLRTVGSGLVHRSLGEGGQCSVGFVSVLFAFRQNCARILGMRDGVTVSNSTLL